MIRKLYTFSSNVDGTQAWTKPNFAVEDGMHFYLDRKLSWRTVLDSGHRIPSLHKLLHPQVHKIYNQAGQNHRLRQTAHFACLSSFY